VKNLLHQALREGRDRLLQAASETGGSKRARNWINYYYRYSEFMFHTPVLFAVGTSTKLLSFMERLGKTGLKTQAHSIQRDLDITVGLALYGYLLKAEEFGLGSCILTAPLTFIEQPEKVLSLEKIHIRCFVATGYPDEKPPLSARKDISEIYRES
jgi:nitroreductase